MDTPSELKVKQAFSKVKEDITSLKTELREIKALFQEFLNKVSPYLKNQSLEKQDNFSTLEGSPKKNNKSSIGNKGDYSFIHSFSHSPFTHLNTYSHTQTDKTHKPTLTFPFIPPQDNQITIQNHPLQTLTNKEFLVFLTVYQLEKELPGVTYGHVAKKLTLTSGCIRSYITSIIRKKAPIVKSKLNNKIILLSIEPSFRSLTSEQKLINLYYQKDPFQSTL